MTTLPDALVWSLGQLFDAQPRRDTGVAALGATWQRHLDTAVSRWRAEVAPLQQASLIAQLEMATHEQNLAGLTELAAPPGQAADAVIYEALRAMAAAGQASVTAEARAAGLELGTPPPLASVTLLDWARAASDVLAAGLTLGVAREALRLYRPGVSAQQLGDGVRTYLSGLTDRPLRDVLGGALTRAQNLGRLAVYGGPRPPRWSVTLVADETLDSNTCRPCERIDGTVLPSPDAAAVAYGGAGYLYCEGRERCRGTVRGIWEHEQPDRTDALWPLGAVLDAFTPQNARHYKRDRRGRFSESDEQRLASAVKAAKALAEDSPDWHRLTGGGSGSGVRMATPPGGDRVIRKQAPDWGSDEPKTQADAEELSSLLGGALDVPVALAHRDEPGVVWISHHSGPTLGEAEERGDGGAALARFNEFRSSGAGLRMGLMDVLTGNNDRNDGNLIIGDDEVIGIDHAFAFQMLGYEHGTPHPDDLGRMGGQHAPATHFIARDEDGRNSFVTKNPMTPGDVIETRTRLEALRGDFDRAGRPEWLDNALLMLDELGKHASGTDSIYG